MPTLSFLGAAGEVTGSAYHLVTPAAKILIDFGMFQGGKIAEKKNRLPHRFKPAELSCVLLTHAHLDHVGRLPLLHKAGYRGPIYATAATIEMASLILRDSAKVQAIDLERENRHRQRAGQPPLAPLYTHDDVDHTLALFRSVNYHEDVTVAPGVSARYLDAGHMLGSASILVTLDGRARSGGSDASPAGYRLAFSGDLGPIGAPQLRDFEPFAQADAVVMESTYGDRDHRAFKDTVDEFIAIVQTAVKRGGKILIPTFAVGRAQVMTLLLGYMFRHKLVEPFPVYLDSPMAIDAWNIYQRHTELFDAETLEFLRNGDLKRDLATLQLTTTTDESKAINGVTGPCVVIAGAGMCNAGRILHHLRNHLWKESTSVLIVGYQAHGSLGRKLVEREPMVKIFGEKIAVRASIHTLNGFSAHAGQTDLLRWATPVATTPPKPRIFLTHGEPRGREPLAAKLRQQFNVSVELPEFGDTVTLF